MILCTRTFISFLHPITASYYSIIRSRTIWSRYYIHFWLIILMLSSLKINAQNVEQNQIEPILRIQYEMNESKVLLYNELNSGTKMCIDNSNCTPTNDQKDNFICNKGFCQKNNSSSNKKNGEELDDQNNKTKQNKKSYAEKHQMALIMTIMGIMFVGMCVALNLFSRARFQKHRGIFSNPRLLKLAKANRSTSRSSRRSSKTLWSGTSNRSTHRKYKHSNRNPKNQMNVSCIDVNLNMNVIPSSNPNELFNDASV